MIMLRMFESEREHEPGLIGVTPNQYEPGLSYGWRFSAPFSQVG